jgi:hypothetical protein
MATLADAKVKQVARVAGGVHDSEHLARSPRFVGPLDEAWIEDRIEDRRARRDRLWAPASRPAAPDRGAAKRET